MAFGEIKLLPRDFYEMSWREFFLTCRGWNKKKDDEYIRDAALTREISYQVYCAMPLKKGKRHVSKKRYWELPFDKEQDDLETQELIKAMKSLKKQNGSRN